MDSDRRDALAAVAETLRPLHKALIEVTQVAYEREHGTVAGPAALFQLLVHDPHFAWLRPMSGLMADLDEILDEDEPIEAARAAELRQRVEGLITEGGHEFSARYLAVLQAEPDVVMAHAALRRALARI
jgi:hypothetical protein